VDKNRRARARQLAVVQLSDLRWFGIAIDEQGEGRKGPNK
jgi:hypothetical protein